MKLKNQLLFYCLCFVTHFSFAQQFGGEPSLVKWKQINTDTVRIIYPSGLDSIAKRVATITSIEQNQYNSTIGQKLHKVSIVLHNQTTFSNGFVALGPWRSEFFLMPEQNAFELGATSWNDLLSIHEYRHVEQYSNFNVGLSHTMKILFGENGQALANAAAVPDWFFEGDAVTNETLLSEQGRGRLPLFLNGYKSLFLEGRNYSYMKLRNGSYKNFVPDHYPLGYMLVAYGREKYGDDFWKDVTQSAARFQSLFYPMQHAIKSYEHIPFNEFVNNALDYYHQQWKNQSYNNIQFIDSIEKNNVNNNKYPYITEAGSLIFLNENYKSNPSFLIKKIDGKVEKIATQSIAGDNYFSYNNNKIVYASFKPSARWGNTEYSEIRLIDINTKKEKKITLQTRYFSPDISHNGKLIAAVQLNINGSSQLHLLELKGQVTDSIEAEHEHIFSYPKFSADDKFLFVCDRNAVGEMSIFKIDLQTKKSTQIIPYKNRVIGFPVVRNDTLFYSCSNNGNDEIWAYVNSSNTNYKVASAATGLYQGNFYDGKIITSAFTANGFRIATILPKWKKINDADTLNSLYVSNPFQKASNTLLQNIEQRNFSTKSYSKFSQPFNFHSRSPYFNDPDYSFVLYGQNVLNTIQSQLYYTYNRDEKFSRVGYTGIYGGWYVQPLIDVNETWHRSASLTIDTTLHWNETKFAAGLQLPLNFTGGKLYRYLTLKSTYNFSSIQWSGVAKQFAKNSSFNYFEGSLRYSQFIQQQIQNIYPRFGQSVSLQYRTGSRAYQFLATGNFYFPGLFKTNNIIINVAYQFRDTSNKYFFDNNFPFSRGYNSFDLPRLFKAGINYHFKLFYPDWGFGNIVYFLRIRANLFYDFTRAKSLATGNHFNFTSTGAEIFFDTKWWNEQPVSFGIRYSRLLNENYSGLNPNQWSFIVPLNL